MTEIGFGASSCRLNGGGVCDTTGSCSLGATNKLGLGGKRNVEEVCVFGSADDDAVSAALVVVVEFCAIFCARLDVDCGASCFGESGRFKDGSDVLLDEFGRDGAGGDDASFTICMLSEGGAIRS